MTDITTDQLNKLPDLGEEHLRLVVEAAPTGMIMVDETGTIVLVNSQVERMFGYSRDELLGQTMDILVPEAELAKLPTPDAVLANPKAKALGVIRNIHGKRKDGTKAPVEIGLNPIVTKKEKFLLASIVDISELKKLEQVVSETDERFRLFMSGVKDCAIILLDTDGLIVSWNEGAQRIKGYTAEEIIGQHFSGFYTPEDLQADRPNKELKIAETEGQFESTGWRVRKDSSRFFASVVISALRDEGGKLRGFAKVTRDITEQTRLEGLLQEKLIELKRSNADLQQFAYVCSHDLQEPLRVISNFTQLLAKRYSGKMLDDTANEFIEFIVDAAKRMQELINALLMYSRVESKGQEFSDTDCSESAEMAIANLEISIRESGAKVECEALPTLKGDSSQLIQLFQNLIGNAIKFRSKVTPQINISAKDTGSSWTFLVKDNGLGFDMKYAERIFVIFQRLYTRDLYPGSGIGLAVCKKIVERHGGRIWVDSVIGDGTSFHFSIPKSAKRVGATT